MLATSATPKTVKDTCQHCTARMPISVPATYVVICAILSNIVSIIFFATGVVAPVFLRRSLLLTALLLTTLLANLTLTGLAGLKWLKSLVRLSIGLAINTA